MLFELNHHPLSTNARSVSRFLMFFVIPREDFKDRMDEIDYSKPVDGQKPIPMEQHWRKHTLSTIEESGQTKLDYR